MNRIERMNSIERKNVSDLINGIEGGPAWRLQTALV
jgi:ERCC4-type nuclease